MGITPPETAESVQNLLLVPQFWLVIAQTVWMKWNHRRQADASYTDHLVKFYTRGETTHVESYGDAWRPVRPVVVELADLQPGDTVLDMATGGGYQAAEFARCGHHTMGMDFVHDRAQLAREQHGEHRLTWARGDISRLPFKDNAFDVVTISLALHDLPLETQMRGLRELSRVARRRVVIAEPRPPERGQFMRWLYANVGELLDESLHFHEFAMRDFDAHLAESGLRVLETRRCANNWIQVFACEPA